MPEVIFDGTDGLDTSAQEAAQAKALEVGEKLIQEQEEAQRDTYDRARKAEESELRFAGKFKSAEDLERAYKELEKKLGQPKEESTEEPTDSEDAASDEEAESPAEESDEGGEEAAPEKLLSKATEEFYSEEGLSEDTLKSLKELSSEELVDAYIKLQENAPTQEAISSEDADAIIKEVGGQDVYKQTLEWAADNLTPDEVAAYDHVINTGSYEAVKFAVQALTLRAKYEGGFEGQPVSGKAVRAQGPKGFRSQAELASAISDPRYRTDPAYRLEVQDRLANSGDLL